MIESCVDTVWKATGRGLQDQNQLVTMASIIEKDGCCRQLEH